MESEVKPVWAELEHLDRRLTSRDYSHFSSGLKTKCNVRFYVRSVMLRFVF